MKTDREAFIHYVEQIAAEEPSYKLGHYGQDGLCDCIGLIIGAIRRAGGEWRGIHGSNYAARKEVSELKAITGSSELEVGEIVLKSYDMNQGGYKLPDRYLPGGDSYTGDMRDYYHIGVVVSVYPLRIRHMTTPKPKVDTSISKWAWHGKLKKISYTEKEDGKMDKVIISGGNTEKPVNLRRAASTGSERIAEIPQGSEAMLIEGGGVWNMIQYGPKTGYVQSQFVHPAGGGGGDDSGGESVTVNRAELEKVYDILGDMLGLRG